MYRAYLCALAFSAWLVSPLHASEPYEPLPAPIVADLAKCDAETHYRTTPSRMGRFFGAVFDDPLAPKQVYSRGVAVVIGISQYDYVQTRLKTLPGVKADVDAMADFLISDANGGQAYDAVVVLREEQVSQSNVFCVVRAIGKLSKPGETNPDRLMFYWSSHGVDVVEGGGKVGYLPYFGVSRDDVNETTALDMRKIYTWAAGYFAGFRQAVFLIDSCVSGYATLTKGGGSERGAVSIKMPSPNAGYEQLMSDLKGLSEQYRMVITASNQEDPAYENVSGGDFTQSFLHLMRDGSPDLVWRGDIFQTSLVDQMQEYQHRRGQQQALFSQPQVEDIPEPQLELFLGKRQSSFLVPANPRLLDMFESALNARESAAAQAKSGAPARPEQDAAGSSEDVGRNSFTDFCGGGAETRLDTMSDEDLIRRDAVCEILISTNGASEALRLTRGEILFERARRAPADQAGQRYAAAEKEFDAAGAAGWARIAGMIYDGFGYERSDANERRMIELARRAYDAGDRKQAANVLGLAYLYGRGVDKQPDKGIELLQVSTDNGYGNAAQNLALELRQQERYPEALRAFLRAGELGKLDAYLYAANLHFDGMLPGEQAARDDEARRLVETVLASDANHPWALNYYGWLYRSGRGMPHDDGKAAEYFERSQKLGYAQAAINLGTMRRTGEGVGQDFAIAASLFDSACRQNYVAGCTELADMKFDGDGFEKTPEVMNEAAQLVDKALGLNGEDRFAIELKAYALRNGYGGPADPQLAETYYRRATDKGSLWAWYQLGNMLRDQAVQLTGEEQQQMLARAMAAFEDGIKRDDSWSMVGKAALFIDSLVKPTGDMRVEIPALLTKPDSEGIVAAFDLLIRLYTTQAYGPPDRVAALPIIRRLLDKPTPEAKRWLAHLMTTGTLYLPENHGLTLLPPWEYYAACGDLGMTSCYGEAGDSLLAMATRNDALSDGEALGFYTGLKGQAALDLALTYFAKGADAGDARSRLALASMKIGNTSPVVVAEGKALFTALRQEGQDVGTVGLAVVGLNEAQPSVAFSDALAAVRGMYVACVRADAVFPGVETPYWPGFGCGRGDIGWPNWTIGLAQTKSRLNLRSKPGGPVVGELAPQTPLLFLQDLAPASKGWLKVQTPSDQVGWVKASYLVPWQDATAAQ